MADEVKTEKGIPIPHRRYGGSSRWELFDVNDSQFFPGSYASIGAHANLWGKSRKRRFTARTVTENGVKGTRVWRIT